MAEFAGLDREYILSLCQAQSRAEVMGEVPVKTPLRRLVWLLARTGGEFIPLNQHQDFIGWILEGKP